MSVKLLEILYAGDADIVTLVTGDTDLAPAVRAAQRLFPTKEIAFAFPYRRRNNELARLVPRYFQIRKEQYARHQFPDPVILPGGQAVAKPPGW